MADRGSGGGAAAPATVAELHSGPDSRPDVQSQPLADETFSATFGGESFPAKYACQVEGCGRGVFAEGLCDEHLHDFPEVLRPNEVEVEEEKERSEGSSDSDSSDDCISDEDDAPALSDISDGDKLIAEFRSTVRAMCRSRLLHELEERP